MPQIYCHLDELLTQKAMTLAQVSRQTGISVVNLSILKNNKAKAIRFSTLIAICQALDCQPGELISYD